MNMPILKVPRNRSEKYTVAFRGINYGEGTQEGELAESRNLTSERFPVLGSLHNPRHNHPWRPCGTGS